MVAPVGAPVEYQEGRLDVVRSARGVQLTAPASPGNYEVRLHGDWPRLPFHLVRTVPLEVTPRSATVGAR